MPPAAIRPQLCVPQLTHGDLVVLESVQSGTAYVVQLADVQAGSPALLYLSDVPLERQRGIEQGTCLEVVQQGDWYGLRSPVLEGLFLQARKKAPHLVFFSARLGVWEQWKVEALYQGVLQQHSPALCLSSRQVPAITLSVRAWRVGTTRSLPLQPPSPPRPLQLDPAPMHAADQRLQGVTAGDAGAGAEYAESATSSLQDDALELSHNVVKGYVTRVTKWPLFLAFRMWRAEARSEVQKRAAAAAHHEHRLQSVAWAAMQQRAAAERHERHLLVLACQCSARQQARRLVRALQLWHGMAFRSSLLERLCKAYQRKDRWRRCAAVLAAWGRLTRDRRALVHQYQKSRLRIATLLSRSILLAWIRVVAEDRSAVRTLQQRHQHRLLLAILREWRAIAQRHLAARRIAAAIAASTADSSLTDALHAWRAWAQRRRLLALRSSLLAAAAARRRLGYAWLAWRNLSTDAAARCQRVELLLAIRRQQLAGCVLRHWLALVAQMATVRFAAEQMGARHQRGRLPAAFARWRGSVGPRSGHRDPEAAPRLMEVLRARLTWERRRATARRVLTSWRRLAAEHMRLLLTAGVAARLKCRSLARDVLSAWRGVLGRDEELGRELLQRHRGAVLRRALRAWAGEAAGARRLAVSAVVARRRLFVLRLRTTFGVWLDAARRSRSLWQRTASQRNAALVRRVLDAWSRRCAAVRAGLAALARCRRGYEFRLMGAVLRAMAWRAALLRAERQFRRRGVAAQSLRVLHAWRRATSHSLRLQSIGRALRGKWMRRLAHAVLRAWWAAAHSAALQVRLLDAIELASWGNGRGGGGLQGFADGIALALAPGYGQGSPAKAGSLVASRQAALRAMPSAGQPGPPVPPAGEQYVATLRLLLASLSGITGVERGVGATSVSMVELLLTRLPALARLAARLRRIAVACFKAWHAVSAAKAKLNGAASRLQARRAAALAAQCLYVWGAVVADVRARRGAALAMALRTAAALLRRCLLAWRQRAKRATRLRRTCLTLLARRTARLQRAVLAAWGGEVAEARARQQEVRRVKQDGRLALMGRTLRAWLAAVALMADLRTLAEKRHAAHWRRAKRQVLGSWRQVTEATQQRLATCARLLQSRAKWRLLGLALSSWRSFAQKEQERRENWPELCRTFFAWRSLVQPAGRAAAAAQAKLEELGLERVQPRQRAREAASQRQEDEEPQLDQDWSPPAEARAPRRAHSGGGPTGPAAPLPQAATPAAPTRAVSTVATQTPAAPQAPVEPSAAPAPAAAASEATAAARVVAASSSSSSSPPEPASSSSLDDGNLDGRSSPPVEVLHSPSRRGPEDYDYPRQHGGSTSSALAAPGAMGMGLPGNAAYMWQQHWNNMMAAGGMGGLAGGPVPLQLPGGGWAQIGGGGGTVILAPVPGTDGADAGALRERLAKLEETVKEQRDAQPAPAGASTAPASAPTRPPLGPSNSSRAMMASCRPEPGPIAQLKQSGGSTAVGRAASTASLSTLPGAGDSGNSAAAPSAAATPAAAQAPAAPAPAPAPAVPTVHVVVHPYGPPPGEGSRPGSPAGSLPSWSRRTTAELDAAFGDRRTGARWRTIEEIEADPPEPPQSQAQPAQPQGSARGQQQAAPASGAQSPAPDPVGPSQTAAASAAASGAERAGPGRAPQASMLQVPPGNLAMADGQPASAAADEEPLPLSPVGSRQSSGVPSDGLPSRRPTGDRTTGDRLTDDDLGLPPQVRYQLGPPPRRVQPYAGWQASLAAQGSVQPQLEPPGSAAASRRGTEDGVVGGSLSGGTSAGSVQWQAQTPYAPHQQQEQQLHHPAAGHPAAPHAPSRLGNAALSHSASEGPGVQPPGGDTTHAAAVFDFASGHQGPGAGSTQVLQPSGPPGWPWPPYGGQPPPLQQPQQQLQQAQAGTALAQPAQPQRPADPVATLAQGGLATTTPQGPFVLPPQQPPHVVVIQQPVPSLQATSTQLPQQAVQAQEQQGQGPPVVHQHFVDGRAVYMTQPAQQQQMQHPLQDPLSSAGRAHTLQHWVEIQEVQQPSERRASEHRRSDSGSGPPGPSLPPPPQQQQQHWQGTSGRQADAAAAAAPAAASASLGAAVGSWPSEQQPLAPTPVAVGAAVPGLPLPPQAQGLQQVPHPGEGGGGSGLPGVPVARGEAQPWSGQPAHSETQGLGVVPGPAAPGAPPVSVSPFAYGGHGAPGTATGVPAGAEAAALGGSPTSPSGSQRRQQQQQQLEPQAGGVVQGWPSAPPLPLPPPPHAPAYGQGAATSMAVGTPVAAGMGMARGSPVSPTAYHVSAHEYAAVPQGLPAATGAPAPGIAAAYGGPGSPTAYHVTGTAVITPGWPAVPQQPASSSQGPFLVQPQPQPPQFLVSPPAPSALEHTPAAMQQQSHLAVHRPLLVMAGPAPMGALEPPGGAIYAPAAATVGAASGGLAQPAAGVPYPTAPAAQPASGIPQQPPSFLVLQTLAGMPPHPQAGMQQPPAGAFQQPLPSAPPLPPSAYSMLSDAPLPPRPAPPPPQQQQEQQEPAGAPALLSIRCPGHMHEGIGVAPATARSASPGASESSRDTATAVLRAGAAGSSNGSNSAGPASRASSPSHAADHAEHSAQTDGLPASAAVLAGIAAAAAAAAMTVGTAAAAAAPAAAAASPPAPAIATATVGTCTSRTSSARTSASGGSASSAAPPAPLPVQPPPPAPSHPAPAPAQSLPSTRDIAAGPSRSSLHAATAPLPSSVAAAPTLAPVAPDMADLDALLGQLEARSRSALTSPRRRLQAAGGGGGGGGPGGALAGPQSVSAGGGGACDGGGAAAPSGLRGLDSIDCLRVRATTLSAPGAPIFGPETTATAVAADAASAWGGIHGVADGDGDQQGVAEGEPDRGELADAALRRLEAASVHAQVAAAAWSAAASAAEAEPAAAAALQGDRGRDAARLAAAVEAAAAAATAAAAETAQRGRLALGGGAEVGAGARPARAPAPGMADERRPAARLPVGAGAVVARKPVAAAELLSTFLPGAEELVRRQARSGQERGPITGQGSRRPVAGQTASAQGAVVGRQPSGGSAVASQTGMQRPAPPQRRQAQQPQRQAAQPQQHQQPQQAAQRQRPGQAAGGAGAAPAGRAGLRSGVAAEEDDGVCPACGSPTRPQRGPSPPTQRPQRPAQQPQHPHSFAQPHHHHHHLQRQDLEAWQPRHSDGGGQQVAARRVRWSLNGGALTAAAAPEGPYDGPYADAPGSYRGSVSGYDSRTESAAGGADLLSSDPLQALAALAQRRGNAQLAATLSGLVQGGPQEAGQWEAPERAPRGWWMQPPAPAFAPPAAHRVAAMHGGVSGGNGGGAGAFPRALGPTAHPHPFGNAAAAAAAAAAADGAASPPRHRALGPPPRRTASSSSACLPSQDSSTTTASATSATTATTASVASAATADTDGGSAAAAARGAGFDPDPLHSPLRGVLGQCRRLQAAAALREAEGDEVIREVVAELSPRSAVAAALSAVLHGQGQRGGGAAGLAEGRRLLAPGGRRL